MVNTTRPRNPTVLSFPKLATVHSRPTRRISLSVADRQQRLPWWDQKIIRSAKLLGVGNGGLGSNQAKIFTQMMVRRQDLIDPDLVELSNLNRQLFFLSDVGRPKAHQLLANLAKFALAPTCLRGYFMRFEEWSQSHSSSRYDAVYCGVDSIATMLAVARYGIKTATPVIFTNVSEDGEACRIFIQRRGPSDACFACYMPKALLEHAGVRNRCSPVPAIADILQVAAGLGARAMIGELLGLPIGDYNCRDISFGGFDIVKTVVRRNECPLCGAGMEL